MQTGKHVLVAEDNIAMASVIRFTLEKVGLNVTVATNGKAGWNELGKSHVDLVVTDFNMPEMTGGELCERIRKDDNLKDIPVILLTAKGLEMDPTYYLDELSVSAIVCKPFSPRELAKIVQEHLPAEAPST